MCYLGITMIRRLYTLLAFLFNLRGANRRITIGDGDVSEAYDRLQNPDQSPPPTYAQAMGHTQIYTQGSFDIADEVYEPPKHLAPLRHIKLWTNTLNHIQYNCDILSLQTMFIEQVYDKAFDENFMVPSACIADRVEVKIFLAVVERDYKNLAKMYCEQENKHSFWGMLGFAKKSTAPSLTKSKDLSEAELKNEIVLLMKNANEMVYKMMVKLHILRFESDNFMNSLENWLNLSIGYKSKSLEIDFLLQQYNVEGEYIAGYLAKHRRVASTLPTACE